MRKKEFLKYVCETCQFDIKKEKVIYMYLCKEKLNKKQKKLLGKEDKFISYGAWRAYIENKYNIYSKRSLVEFEKILNLLIVDSERMDGYNQCIWAAYISSVLSVVISVIINELETGKISLITCILFLPCFIGIVIGRVFNNYNEEKITLLFFKDMKEIIEEIINNK